MTFLIRPGTPLRVARLQAKAFATWREAELSVQQRWDEFLTADGRSRRGAFAAYVAALDAETAAAGDLAGAYSHLIGAA